MHSSRYLEQCDRTRSCDIERLNVSADWNGYHKVTYRPNLSTDAASLRAEHQSDGQRNLAGEYRLSVRTGIERGYPPTMFLNVLDRLADVDYLLDWKRLDRAR